LTVYGFQRGGCRSLFLHENRHFGDGDAELLEI
jgi:hypothetical protein